MFKCHFSFQFSREFTFSHALPDRKIPLAAQQMCQPCVTRVTLEKGCKRPVHRRCVSVSTYFSRKHILITFFVNFLNFNLPSFMQQADFSF